MARTVTALSGDAALANEVGIPTAVLRALRAVESSSNPRAVRFEPRVFSTLTSGRHDSEINPQSFSRAAFEHAYGFDPAAAVRATSWGSFQVLGGHLLSLAGGNARGAVAMFDADPVAVSDALFVEWLRTCARAVAAANALDFQSLATAYNAGCASSTPRPSYAAQLEAAYQAALALEGTSPLKVLGWSIVGLSGMALGWWAWRKWGRR